MKRKNTNNQSRRDFFKKAAKAALPILGLAVMAGNPIVAKAAETAMGCSSYCSGSCKDSCANGCTGTCTGGCSGGCGSTCSGRCLGSCSATCASSCYKVSR